MNLLSDLVGLCHKVSIYVPSTHNVSTIIDNERHVQLVEKEFSTKFGGSTRYETIGCYLSTKGEVIRERITIVYSFVAEIDNDVTDFLIRLAEKLKFDMQQESVAVEIDSVMYFM